VIHLSTDSSYLKPMRKFFKQREVRH